ncbi:MAG: hypothetical protein ABW116_18825 [Candidatus Sedimenticola sp. 20ELBAFRAG]
MIAVTADGGDIKRQGFHGVGGLAGVLSRFYGDASGYSEKWSEGNLCAFAAKICRAGGQVFLLNAYFWWHDLHLAKEGVQ